MAKKFGELAIEMRPVHDAAYSEELAARATIENTEKDARALARADWRKEVRAGLAKTHTERLNNVYVAE